MREVEEEVCVTPVDLSECGELKFQFTDGLSIHVFVYRARDCVGEVGETDEALPLWTPLSELPYDEMWADDRLWVPHMLAGTPFRGRFLFADDEMLGYELEAPAAQSERP